MRQYRHRKSLGRNPVTTEERTMKQIRLFKTAKEECTMLIERVNHSGAWVISEIINSALVTKKYLGYSRKEAIQLFKQETKGH